MRYAICEMNLLEMERILDELSLSAAPSFSIFFFFLQVSLLSQIRHQNLVTLEGFCHESKQQILVYEYLPGGSLSDNLYGNLCQNVSYAFSTQESVICNSWFPSINRANYYFRGEQ